MSDHMMTAKSVISALGSAAATAVVARSIINDLLPYEIRDYLSSTLHSIFNRRFSSEISIIVDEFDGLNTNQIFEAAELYLGARTKSATSAHTFKVRKSEADKQIHINLDRDEEMVDVYEGIKFRWILQCHKVKDSFDNPRDMNSSMRSEVRFFLLIFHKKFKNVALEKYLPYIINETELLKQETRALKLFTVDPDHRYQSPADVWTSIRLNHPATFDTLAMDSELKEMIMEDLERFVRRKEYYRRVGKAWKRGYLLYGPPGTGKSSLIAAMANYLNFDIYDLELSEMRCNSELRKVLVATANKSILVVEDIDCSVKFHDRDNNNDDDNEYAGHRQQEKVTLSGLLNFIDGLWSSCGDERIIIFTTNHKDKLDPALLRPGRMDLHIHMSYCTPCGFNLLAYNYLGIKHHELFNNIERLIEEAQVTPAEVAEQLMRQNEPDFALTGLVEFLELKKVANAKAEEKKLEVDSKIKHNVEATKESVDKQTK
ncbi:Protein HYPER-SENSITIVITY-RELATED 4 [Bienertia sinuspersici]